jgi:Kef-type K+ transport system membrane component KefB
VRQVVILAALLLIAALSTELGERVQDSIAVDAKTLSAAGFIMLAAYAFGELLRRFRLPALLGYLGAGMLFGPSLAEIALGSREAAPISEVGLEGLALVNMLAVGVIGTMGGGEIKIEDLKESFRKIAAVTAVIFVLVLPGIAALVLALITYAPSLVPFMAEEPFAAQIAAALLFGALAVGMSPAATLALLLEVRAQGRFTSLVLGIVVLADLLLVATFLLTLALGKLIVSPEGFSTARLLEALPHIGAEFGWAILLGVIVGLVFIAYLRLVGRELLLFSLGIIFITSFVASRLHAETLLAFLVAGFVVQNFSRHGHTLIEAFERIALPVFVIYFTTQAARLDLVAVTVYLPLTLLLVGTRCGLFYWGISAAAKIARVDDQQRQLLRISFFSQGGVDLVLAAMIAKGIPGWGVEVQTVTVATILFYIVLGPPLLARALDRAGESAAARERGAETLEARRPVQEAPRHRATLAWLETGDAELDRRLKALRSVIKEVLHEVVRDTAVVRAQARREAMTTLSHAITAALDPAGVVRDDDTLDGPRLRERLRAVHAEVARGLGALGDPAALVPVDAAIVSEAFERLVDAEQLGTIYRIAREPALFEIRGTRGQRLIRVGRRVRRSLFGPGMRTVPVGRLWRYHVALDVPVVFWGSIRAQEGEGWSALLRHYRKTCRAADELLALAEPDAPRTITAPTGRNALLSGSYAKLPPAAHGHHDADHDEGEPAEDLSPRALLQRAHGEAQEREQALVRARQDQDHELEHRLEGALDDAWDAFTRSVEVAGTLEHPAWRYRVSTRYDTAQAATAELRERLDRDREAAAGTRDTIALLASTARFGEGVGQEIERLAGALRRDLETNAPQFQRVQELCPALASAPDVQGHCEVATGLHGAIDELAAALDEVARRLDEPEAVAARGTALAATLFEVPAVLEPVPLGSIDAIADGNERRVGISLRGWLDQAVARELTVAVLDVRAHAAKHVADVVTSLQHAKQVLDYHLVTAPRAGERVDRGVGERVSSLVERAGEELQVAARQVDEELRAHWARIRDRGLVPLLEGRWRDVQRQARRLDEGTGLRGTLAERVRDRILHDAARRRRASRRLRDEVAALFVERTTPPALEAYRRLLFGPASTMNDAYQRLFTSAPAESIGLVLDRPEVATVEAGVERWLQGRGGPILVRGDRGVGKRTIIRHVSNRMGDRIALRWLPLSPDFDTEADVARRLAPMLGLPSAPRFDALTASAPRFARPELRGTRTAIVVANVERLFRRTPDGLDRIRRFFDLVAATSGDVLWIVLFAEPAARLLAPVLELEGRFPVTVTVPPMTTRQLADVLELRHRLSGYAIAFRHHTPSLHEWVRSPAAAWRTRRRTGAATYERIGLLSAGNVRQALRLWLAAARLEVPAGAHDDGDHGFAASRAAGRVLVGPLEALPDALVEELPLISRLLLAALLLHGPLRRDELSAVTLRQGHALDAEITHLVHLGFLSLQSDPPGPHGEREVLVQVNTRLIAPLTQELRACNLL